MYCVHCACTTAPVPYQCGIQLVFTTIDLSVYLSTEAELNAYPWLVSISYEEETGSSLRPHRRCCGTVIDPLWVITSASCLYVYIKNILSICNFVSIFILKYRPMRRFLIAILIRSDGGCIISYNPWL